MELDKLSLFVHSVLNEHIELNNDYEMIWALSFANKFMICIDENTTKKLTKYENSLVNILVMILNDKNLIYPTVDFSDYKRFIVNNDLYDENWMFLYECCINNWLEKDSTILNNDRFFKQLLQHSITFISPNYSKVKMEVKDIICSRCIKKYSLDANSELLSLLEDVISEYQINLDEDFKEIIRTTLQTQIEQIERTVEEMSSEKTVETEEEMSSEKTVETEEEMSSEKTVETEEEMLSEETVETEEMLSEETVETEEMLSEETVETEEEMLSEETVETEEEMLSEETVETEEEMLSEETVETEEEMLSEETVETEEEMLLEETVETEEMLSEETVNTEEEMSLEENARELSSWSRLFLLSKIDNKRISSFVEEEY
ncbi:hypothetical protein [Lysinibacillus sp. Ag94]|uniref:hypothetical protein n=1 Tax=Lysinibacillus sp. Ag94 TaxID=2936682 RepID=UPI00200D0414|nr:hypothetical protein [Lysinibacillus sp. Ag94]UPW83554.1 hypothetical protein MY533_01360 [Lysinibacillus sp. Ag94]